MVYDVFQGRLKSFAPFGGLGRLSKYRKFFYLKELVTNAHKQFGVCVRNREQCRNNSMNDNCFRFRTTTLRCGIHGQADSGLKGECDNSCNGTISQNFSR
ncbi:hypothetical protein CEXT_443941 [Caerostris extrusa]|uniref:Uncharacterized protein n=1 Tax=Caerostris extrusa TaxID=172846 RepID=A0AAV4VDE2_CAEEX|nr:hypothetical protein CEXT_443941 [Caerostris extrusa]